MTRLALILVLAAASGLAGCGGSGGSHESAACENGDGALDKTAFVFVESPGSGERVLSGFRVAGCSSTFESNVDWRLRARNGQVLASGFAQGGGVEAAPFEFTVDYPLGERQVGHLEVFEPQVTSEGHPAVKNVLPLVLEP